MELTKEQRVIAEEILKFKKPIQILAAAAGCGKSFLVSHLKKRLPHAAVCAPTGKAAHVLREKGVYDASTIHSLIYKPLTDSFGKIKLDKNGSPTFILNKSLDCSHIFVDEFSMVSKDLYRDLCSFKIPLLFTGDNFQLEPVGEAVDLLSKPDFTLETIHRNAGEIAFFAEHIRKGGDPLTFKTQGKIFFISSEKAPDYFSKVDQIICAFNKSRVSVNKEVRKKTGIETNLPVKGDRVICLRNNKEKGLFNGMQGIVEKLLPKNKFTLNSDDFVIDTSYNPKQFHSEKTLLDTDKDSPMPFDYAYCVTCHKMQGSESDNVMVLEQKCKHWCHLKWCYTSASRAKKAIIWASNYYSRD